MPPWMTRDDTDDVPPPRSPLSTRAVRKPRRAASRAIPAPVIPPPMTSKSTGSAAIEASAAVRVRCEKGVSLVDRSPAWPPHGAMIRFEQLTPGRCPGVNRRLCPPRAAGPGTAEGECNARWERTACRGDRRVPDAVLQIGDDVEGRTGRGPGQVRGP